MLGAFTVNWFESPFWTMLAAAIGPTTSVPSEAKIEIDAE